MQVSLDSVHDTTMYVASGPRNPSLQLRYSWISKKPLTQHGILACSISQKNYCGALRLHVCATCFASRHQTIVRNHATLTNCTRLCPDSREDLRMGTTQTDKLGRTWTSRRIAWRHYGRNEIRLSPVVAARRLSWWFWKLHSVPLIFHLLASWWPLFTGNTGLRESMSAERVAHGTMAAGAV
jgi:hypothetical protein